MPDCKFQVSIKKKKKNRQSSIAPKVYAIEKNVKLFQALFILKNYYYYIQCQSITKSRDDGLKTFFEKCQKQ